MDKLITHFDEPQLCPYCGSDQIDGQAVEIETQWARQFVHCTACGRQWQDRYRLAEVVDDAGHPHARPLLARIISDAIPERDVRQRQIVPPEPLQRVHATVVGVGAIGRQLALQLAAIGVPKLELVDPQIVEAENLAAQGYLEADQGLPKAEATARLALQLNSQIAIDPFIQRFRRSQDVGNVVFACVDTIETRRLIYEAVRDRVMFFGDGRMSAEVVRVLSVADDQSRQHYPGTLFDSDEAHHEACTARSTIFTANITAGLMIEQFTRHLRRMPVDPDLTLNLLTSELTLNPDSTDHQPN